MKQPYIMRTEFDCGPAAISAVTGIEYEIILQNWPGGWLRTSDRGRIGIPNDTPWDHFALLEKLKIPYSVIDIPFIKTDDILLVHRSKNTNKFLRFLEATLNQHWVVIGQVVPGKHVGVYWGKKDEEKIHTWQEINDMYYSGWPNCLYRIGEGNHKMKWWHKAVAKLTGKIF